MVAGRVWLICWMLWVGWRFRRDGDFWFNGATYAICDVRLLVPATLDRGEAQALVAHRFGIGERIVRRFKKRQSTHDEVTAEKAGSKKLTKLIREGDALLLERVCAEGVCIRHRCMLGMRWISGGLRQLTHHIFCGCVRR